MGPTWSFLLIFESRVERHSFCGIETLNGHMISQVNRLSTDPRVGASQFCTFQIIIIILRNIIKLGP